MPHTLKPEGERANCAIAYSRSHGRRLSMKAAVFQGFGKPLQVVDHTDPEPAEGEVVLKVGRCGICGSDLHMTEPGGMAPPVGSIVGHEISGEVVALGKNVTRLRIGDRVAAMPIAGCGSCPACLAGEPSWCVKGVNFLAGGFAEYARAGENECLRLPSRLSATDGALVEPLAVALHGARMVSDLSGSKVKVIGAGPIGLAATYWARRFGAACIEVVEGNPHRAEMALNMGADQALPPEPAEPGQSVTPATDPPDFVFECVGKPGLLSTAVSHVRPRGTVISLGFCMAPEQIVSALANMREVTIKFPILYTIDDYRLTLDTLDAGRVEPRAMVTDVVGFDALPEAFEALRKPRHQCKVMVDPWAG
jgi:(R,R)-butanediol dehydrogenase/meso-butanediol dehydrogenase/diacetyl reductase